MWSHSFCLFYWELRYTVPWRWQLFDIYMWHFLLRDIQITLTCMRKSWIFFWIIFIKTLTYSKGSRERRDHDFIIVNKFYFLFMFDLLWRWNRWWGINSKSIFYRNLFLRELREGRTHNFHTFYKINIFLYKTLFLLSLPSLPP